MFKAHLPPPLNNRLLKISFLVIKSRRMRWTGHVARMVEKSCAYRVWWGNLRERDHLEDLSVEGKLILKWILKEWGG